MRRHRLRAVLIAILAMQVVVAPAVFASSSALTQSSAASSDCPDHMQRGDKSCPCCPEGGVMVAGCMNLCTAFAATFGIIVPMVMLVPSASPAFESPSIATQIYAPPNPPPIR
ncbi:MAG: hypothetical protein AMXMBFR37_06960 [Steroidobacteraceae bacterium]|jgi:hypothetical protein